MTTIKTRYRRPIPKGLSYPVGAEAISSALDGVPQFDELSFAFWCASPSQSLKVPSDTETFVEVLRASFSKISPGATGSNHGVELGWYSEKWALEVYPVPSESKARVREGLLKSGLPGIRTWLMTPRDQTWRYGRHSCVAAARLLDGEIHVTESASDR